MRAILYPGKTLRQYHRWTVRVMARCRVLALSVLLGLISPDAGAAGSPAAGQDAPTGALHGTSFLLTGSMKERLEALGGPAGFMSSANLSLARVESAPVPIRLLGGRVLVAGWVVNRGISASAELYDPSTDSWLAAGAFTSSRDSRNTIFPRARRMLVWAGIVIPF